MTQSGDIRADQTIDNLFDQIKDLQERLDQLESHSLTSQNVQANLIALGDARVGDLLAGDLAASGYAYNNGLAQADIISACLGLPGLRAFYPMTAHASGGGAKDLSGNDLNLTNSGQVQYSWVVTDDDPTKGVAMANFGAASSDRLHRADEAAFYVSGNETFMVSTRQGLTAGAWVRPIDLGTAAEGIMGQWDTGSNQKSWSLYFGTSSQFTVYITSDGSTNVSKSVGSGTHTIENDKWSFLCLQWSPSARDNYLRAWVDDMSWTNTSPGVATLHNSTANFGIGHLYNSGTPDRYFEGQISMAFMCACNIGDDNISRLYEQTRSYFRPGDKT
jgi:hypothetical protein